MWGQKDKQQNMAPFPEAEAISKPYMNGIPNLRVNILIFSLSKGWRDWGGGEKNPRKPLNC